MGKVESVTMKTVGVHGIKLEEVVPGELWEAHTPRWVLRVEKRADDGPFQYRARCQLTGMGETPQEALDHALLLVQK